MKSQDERLGDSKTARWAGARLTPARTCQPAFTCSPAGGGPAKPQNSHRPRSSEHCGRGCSKPDVSTGVAPDREGAGILIVWHECAHCSSGEEKRVEDHWRWQKHALIPPAEVSKAAHYLGRGWRLAGSLFQAATPTLQEPLQVSWDQESEASEGVINSTEVLKRGRPAGSEWAQPSSTQPGIHKTNPTLSRKGHFTSCGLSLLPCRWQGRGGVSGSSQPRRWEGGDSQSGCGERKNPTEESEAHPTQGG